MRLTPPRVPAHLGGLSTPHSAIEPTADRSRSGWDVLSLMRFFLALIVALSHARQYGPLGPLAWLDRLGSFEAILGFLLISGYSIGHSIQKRPEGYFVRRIFRIYPVYLAAIVITYAVQRDAWTPSFTLHFIPNLFFLGELVQRDTYVGPGWTLNLEVWLYALAPWFLRLRASTLERLIGGSIVCYAGYELCRSLFHAPHYATTIGGINLPCLGFIWIAGFYLSTARSRQRPLAIAGLLFAANILVVAGIQLLVRIKHHDVRDFFVTDIWDFLMRALLLAFVFLVFRGVIAHRFHLARWQSRIARFLGDISYPLYLVHYAVFVYFSQYFKDPVLLILTAMGVASIVYFGCDFYSRKRKLS
jgi:peptidoglycan/LPS O-acetylase OafA/YrhL